jgi:hypothetical protein
VPGAQEHEKTLGAWAQAKPLKAAVVRRRNPLHETGRNRTVREPERATVADEPAPRRVPTMGPFASFAPRSARSG